MESSSASSHSPSPVRPGSERPLPSRGAEDDWTEEIRIGKRLWRIKKADADRLPRCSVCLYSLAQSSLCSDVTHALCPECLPRILGSRTDCVECRQPFENETTRAIQDRSLRQTQRALLDKVFAQCTVCERWSGRLSEVDRHSARCGEKQPSCQWEGCDWVGVADRLAGHVLQCSWRPVACSLPGCDVRIPLRHKEDHEAACDYRPARFGALGSTVGSLRQLEELNQWCLNGRLSGGAWSQKALQEEVLPRLERSVPLLYEAVRTAVPAGSTDSEAVCPWECGFRTTVNWMSAHYPHCPRALVKCDYCPARMPRSALAEHVAGCDDRPVSCPQGCGQQGLRARDITATGIHLSQCRTLTCDDCHIRLPWPQGHNRDFIINKHKEDCGGTPRHCDWCFASHPKAGFSRASALCRDRLPDLAPFWRGQRLVLHPAAHGPVYVVREDQDDQVFVRLSGEALWAAVMNQRTWEINLTPGLRLVWNGLSCSVSCICSCGVFTFTLVNHSAQGQNGHFAACLRKADGSLVEELGSFPAGKAGRGQDESARPEPQVILKKGKTEEIPLHSLNALVGQASERAAVVLHLATHSCRD